MDSFKIEQEVTLEEARLSMSKDYISLLIHKTRARLALFSSGNMQVTRARELAHLFDTIQNKYRKVTLFLRMLSEFPEVNLYRMQEILAKQETRVGNVQGYFETGHAHTHILKIQGIAYNYYYYIKRNHIPIDYFKNPKDYFSPYVKTVLTSYVIPQSDSPGIFGISTHHEPYVLNEIDLDIFVKFTTQKQLKEWLNSYSISAIKLDATIDVTKKYINLCKSLERFCVEQWLEWIHSFSTLVGVIDLDDDDKKELLCQITYTFKFFAKQSPHFATRLFESIHSLVESLTIVELQDANELLSAILDDSIFQSLYDLHQSLLRNVIQGLSPSLDNESRTNMTNRIFEIADKHSRIKKILIAHDALSLSEHAEFLRESMDMIDSENLFMLLYKKVLTFDQGIEDLFVNRIHAEHTERTNNKGVYPYPDWLVINIEKCLLLKLIGFEINLDRLKSYTNYSTHLEFMLSPEDFDYSKVDLNHYMWQNLLYSPKYQQFFIEQKAEILTEKLHDAFRKRKDTRDQQKIVFGILLDDNELRSY